MWLFNLLFLCLVEVIVLNASEKENLNTENSWVHEKYYREIDVSQVYPSEIHLITLKNNLKVNQTEYIFFNDDKFDYTKKLFSVLLKQETSIKLEFKKIEKTKYKIYFNKEIESGEKLKISLKFVIFNGIVPYRDQNNISNKRLNYLLNIFPYTPYITNKYELQIKNADDFLKKLVDINNKKKEINLVKNGVNSYNFKYEKTIRSYTFVPVVFDYLFNKKIIKIVHFEKSVYVSTLFTKHINFKEYYSLINYSPIIEKNFDRIKFLNLNQLLRGGHYNYFIFNKKKDVQFNNYYIKDLNGYVWDHKLTNDAVFLKPRFPLTPGTHYNYTFGWDEERSMYFRKLREKKNFYILKLSMLNSFASATYEKINYNFYLPENTIPIGFALYINTDSIKISFEKSIFSYKGNLKLTLSYDHLHDKMKNFNIYLVFYYNRFDILWKLLYPFLMIFSFLLFIYLLKNVNCSINFINLKQKVI